MYEYITDNRELVVWIHMYEINFECSVARSRNHKTVLLLPIVFRIHIDCMVVFNVLKILMALRLGALKFQFFLI